MRKGVTPRREWYADTGLHIIKFRDIGGEINWEPGLRGRVKPQYEGKLRRLQAGMTLIGADAHNPEFIGRKVSFADSIPEEPVFFSAELLAMAPKPDGRIAPKWPFFWFSSQGGYLAVQEKVVGVHLNSNPAKTIEIPLPPVSEQERIVGILNNEMATVERAREAALERIEAVRALASAWLCEVFPSSEDGLPKGWRWTTLGEIATAFRGVNFSSGEGQPIPEEGYTACLTTSGVQDIPDWNSRRFIPSERIKSDSQLLSVGDIMVSTANSKALVGKSCLVSDVPYECAFGAFVTVIRSSPQTLPAWISHAIRTNQAKQFFYEKSSHTTNISNLKISALLEMPIPLPPLAEQKRLVSALNAKMAATEQALSAAEAELAAIEALPGALLRRAFGGEV